jgi:hypothetical protein
VKAKPGQKKVRVQDEIYNYLKLDIENYVKSKSNNDSAL